MANLADITDTNDFTEEALTRQRTTHPGDTALVRRGNCLNCGELTLNLVLYCDAECREDYELSERINRHTRKAP